MRVSVRDSSPATTTTTAPYNERINESNFRTAKENHRYFIRFFFRSSPCKKSVKIRNVDFNRKLWPLSGNKFCTAFDFACRNLYDFIILFFFVYFHSILKHSMFESLNFIILAIARQLTQPSVNIFSFKIRNLCSTIYDHSHTGKTSVARVRSSENSNKKIAE